MSISLINVRFWFIIYLGTRLKLRTCMVKRTLVSSSVVPGSDSLMFVLDLRPMGRDRVFRRSRKIWIDIKFAQKLLYFLFLSSYQYLVFVLFSFCFCWVNSRKLRKVLIQSKFNKQYFSKICTFDSLDLSDKFMEIHFANKCFIPASGGHEWSNSKYSGHSK